MENAQASELLKEFCEVADSQGLRPFAVAGTLLGIIREGDFIENDDDIDMGIFGLTEDARVGFVVALERKGWKLWREFGNMYTGWQFAFIKEQTKIDLIVYYQLPGIDVGYAWITTDTRNEMELCVYPFKAFNLEKRKFKGFDIWVPSDADKYLEQQFGKEWEHKAHGWHYYFSARNAYRTGIYMPKKEY